MTTKILYLHDSMDPRVMTIVSDVQGDKVHYGYSLNRPTRWVANVGKTWVSADRVKGDQFNKVRGRQIATDRMTKDPLIADLAGRTPDVAILETLRDASENSIVRRLCGDELAHREIVQKLRELRDLAHPPAK